jgi:hypothetical protein
MGESNYFDGSCKRCIFFAFFFARVGRSCHRRRFSRAPHLFRRAYAAPYSPRCGESGDISHVGIFPAAPPPTNSMVFEIRTVALPFPAVACCFNPRLKKANVHSQRSHSVHVRFAYTERFVVVVCRRSLSQIARHALSRRALEFASV